MSFSKEIKLLATTVNSLDEEHTRRTSYKHSEAFPNCSTCSLIEKSRDFLRERGVLRWDKFPEVERVEV
jgi:hypothetical protein